MYLPHKYNVVDHKDHHFQLNLTDFQKMDLLLKNSSLEEGLLPKPCKRL